MNVTACGKSSRNKQMEPAHINQCHAFETHIHGARFPRSPHRPTQLNTESSTCGGGRLTQTKERLREGRNHSSIQLFVQEFSCRARELSCRARVLLSCESSVVVREFSCRARELSCRARVQLPCESYTRSRARQQMSTHDVCILAVSGCNVTIRR